MYFHAVSRHRAFRSRHRAPSHSNAATYQSPGADDDDAGDSAKLARSSSKNIHRFPLASASSPAATRALAT
jgi:hypothetical protein